MSKETSNYELTKMCVLLQSEEKKRRIIGLKDILKMLELQSSENEVITLWNVVNKPLLRILNDSVERCRDLAIEINKLFLMNLIPNDAYITYLLPILSRRLGSSELIETSEEVRLKCVTLLKLIIVKYKTLLGSYVDDLTKILVRTVADNYPLVKRESCECVSEFAKNLPRFFYTQSGNLIESLLSNFTHQHYRVRIASIKTTGDVIQYGNSKSMEDVATPLAERLFDQNGFVREAVIEVAGNWLLKLRDRYSWWHKILPLLLTGLHDTLEEIRNKAANFWEAAGQLYIEENENDEKFKDKMDFLTADPQHYPNVARPNLGCRVISQLTFSKLINGINLELGDWLADIRVRSAQLLCVLILNIEEDVTQHVAKLLPHMCRACNDEDNRVVENVEKAAEYLGYFVPPKTYCRLIIPMLEETPLVGHLKVLSAILRGSERSTVVKVLEDIGSFLQQPHICQSKKESYQKQILSCCHSLISVCKEDCKLISADLFIVIWTVLSMSKENAIKIEAKELLNTLASLNSFANVDELYYEHIVTLISSFADCKSWTIHTPESQIFSACLIHIKTILSSNMQIVLPILKEIMANDADPELRLRYFILLAEHFNDESEHDKIDVQFLRVFLEDCMLPGLIWTAGRAAEAIRTAAISCLCAFLQKYVTDPLTTNEPCFADENYSLIFDKLIPILISLADDNSKKSRLYSLRAMYLLMCIQVINNNFTEEYLHKMYPVLLKRLDDGCDDVRYAALEALVKVWNAKPQNYDLQFNKAHIDCLYTTTIIYLDDPETEFQRVTLDSLKELARVHPELLHQKLQNCKTNFRNQEGIEILIEHCHTILRNN